MASSSQERTMSFLDRVVAAVTPLASDKQRAEARREVEKLAAGEQWLAMIVDQHKDIERRFDEAFSASDPEVRKVAAKRLAAELTGHSTAEEAVIYPGIAEHDSKVHAGMAYEEHAMTKIQLAKLEKLDPLSIDWVEKLKHIQSAVQQHVYQEESSWLPNLTKHTPPEEKAMLSARYAEEYERYFGGQREAQQIGA
jgi:hemerythrin superfamily protein